MLTLTKVIECVEGQRSPSTKIDQPIRSFSIDTRTLKAGDVFVALQGDAHHGNDFIENALERGAIAVITDREPPSHDIPFILVKDSLLALTRVAEYQRSIFKGKVCGVTGTVGKTSVKEALSYVGRQLGLTVHASEKSYNNHIGVPLTLANLDQAANVAVIEMGMNHPGEILALTQLVKPDIAIVTAVGPGHIEFFNSVADIAKEKVSIAAALVEQGVAILPADSEFFELMRNIVNEAYHRSVMSFGKAVMADVKATTVQLDELKLQINADVGHQNISYELPTTNPGWVNNSLAILAAVQTLGLDVHDAARHLATLPRVDGRGKMYSITINGKHILLIDDAYNANPMSMKASLEMLSMYEGRKVAVIGDMRELGQFGEYYHTEVGHYCTSLKIDKVLTCGILMQHAYEHVSEPQRIGHVEDYTRVIDQLMDHVLDGDVVLFKASNGVKLHKVVADILAQDG